MKQEAQSSAESYLTPKPTLPGPGVGGQSPLPPGPTSKVLPNASLWWQLLRKPPQSPGPPGSQWTADTLGRLVSSFLLCGQEPGAGGGELCPALPCWLPHLGAHVATFQAQLDWRSFLRLSFPLGALVTVPTTTLGLKGNLPCLPPPVLYSEHGGPDHHGPCKPAESS